MKTGRAFYWLETQSAEGLSFCECPDPCGPEPGPGLETRPGIFSIRPTERAGNISETVRYRSHKKRYQLSSHRRAATDKPY